MNFHDFRCDWAAYTNVFWTRFSFLEMLSFYYGLLSLLETENDFQKVLLYKAQTLVSRAPWTDFGAVGLMFYNVSGTRFAFLEMLSFYYGLLSFLETENDVQQTLLYKAQTLVTRAPWTDCGAVGLMFYNVSGTRFSFLEMLSFTMDYLVFWKPKTTFSKRCYIKPKRLSVLLSSRFSMPLTLCFTMFS